MSARLTPQPLWAALAALALLALAAVCCGTWGVRVDDPKELPEQVETEEDDDAEG